jgi:hypothetical protein
MKKTKREIKFRGKRIDNGEWIYGLLLKNINGDCAIQVECNNIEDGWWKSVACIPVIRESVGQYINLDTPNESMVYYEAEQLYEGDILSSGSCKYVVEYDEGKFFGISNEGDKYGLYTMNLDKHSFRSSFHPIKKVGNIIDNPELMK